MWTFKCLSKQNLKLSKLMEIVQPKVRLVTTKTRNNINLEQPKLKIIRNNLKVEKLKVRAARIMAEALPQNDDDELKTETKVKLAELPKLPEWLQAKAFEELMRKRNQDFKRIIHFETKSALPVGENYATVISRVMLHVELKDGSIEQITYMIKLPHDNDTFRSLMKLLDMFEVEPKMYFEVIPELERMYQEVGVEMTFAPKCYKLTTDEKYVLLEDLRPRNFKNANRLKGLDLIHTKCVLKKLAEMHAATATRFETRGKYDEIFRVGFFKESNRATMTEINHKLSKAFKKCISLYDGHEVYKEALVNFQDIYMDELYKAARIDPDEFNVLNHGDLWTNNIMFQYDKSGTILETYFVDYQMPKFGSPAQDLLYFLLSSTSYELKLNKFEYFIKFYHDHLAANLELLGYPKKIPTLKDIHIQLYKYGIWGYSIVTGLISAVLLDPSEDANVVNYLNDDEAGNDFKLLMYSSQRYRKHIEVLLPWLFNRGVLSPSE